MKLKSLVPVAIASILSCLGCGSGSGSSTTPPPPTPTPTPTGQISIVSSFAGDTRACTTTGPGCGNHPDPAIGVGLTYVALYNRQGLTVYNKVGSLYQSTVSGPAFWAAAGIPGILQPNITDPRATYDIFTHRYLVVQSILSQTNCGDLLAVSAADDPTQWKAINVSGHCGDIVMTVGYDNNGVYTCEQDLASNPVGSICAAIPAADTKWSGTGNIVTSHLVVVITSAGSVGDGRYGPAININPSTGFSDPMVLISRPGVQDYPSGTPLVLNYRKWTWTDANTPVLSAATSINTGYTYYMNSLEGPPFSMTAQPNSPSVPYLNGWEGARNSQPVVDLAGNIWLTMGSDIGSENGNLGFYWFKIPVSTMTIAASGVVYDSVGSSGITYGTAAIDANGNAYFFYHQGSEAEYWSHYVRVVPSGSSTMSAATLLKAGGPNAILSSSSQPVVS